MDPEDGVGWIPSTRMVHVPAGRLPRGEPAVASGWNKCPAYVSPAKIHHCPGVDACPS